jgi:hypothetical protein
MGEKIRIRRSWPFTLLKLRYRKLAAPEFTARLLRRDGEGASRLVGVPEDENEG